MKIAEAPPIVETHIIDNGETRRSVWARWEYRRSIGPCQCDLSGERQAHSHITYRRSVARLTPSQFDPPE
ncbi:MAG: hypothetical protein R3C40_03380 [Parvularculaceae bacterium]